MSTRPARAPEGLVVAAADNVLVRRKRRSDAADEFRWLSDSEISRFDGNAPRAGGLEEFLVSFDYELTFGRPQREAFALESPSGEHIGSIMYYNADGESAELGISIAIEEYRGRGLGREAVIAFLRFLWSERAFRRIYLHTFEWNERARRCFSAAGFEVTARVLRDGERFIRMEVRREWWLLWDGQGRFSS